MAKKKCPKCGGPHDSKKCRVRQAAQPQQQQPASQGSGPGPSTQTQRSGQPAVTVNPGSFNLASHTESVGGGYGFVSQTEIAATNPGVVLTRINEHANRVATSTGQSVGGDMAALRISDGPSQGATKPSQSKLSAAEIEKQASAVKLDYGLRKSFGTAGTELEIATNYLSLTMPDRIHVYKVEMVDAMVRGQPVELKKQSERMEVLRQIAPRITELHQSSTWVHDGTFIWSTTPLWRNAQLDSIVHTAPATWAYNDEMGRTLQLIALRVKYVHDIDVSNTAVGELFYEEAANAADDGIPAILTAGLNAFLTSNVRQPNSRITTVGNNRSFAKVVGDSLRRAGDQSNVVPLRALKGFFLSTRPGNDKMLININTTTSPFFQKMTVADFIRRVRTHAYRRTDGAIKGILRGVKVRITYETKGGIRNPEEQFRFITGLDFQGAGLLDISSRYDQVQTLKEWYARESPYFRHSAYPQPWHVSFNLQDGEVCVKVGGGTRPNAPPLEWYPASKLEIVEWQPFRGTLTTDETNSMIGVALRSPILNVKTLLGPSPDQSLQPGIAHFGFNTSTQGRLNDFGMHAGTNLLKVKGRVLSVPGIRYHGQATGQPLRPSNASWNLARTRFFTSAAVTAIPILDLSNTGTVSDRLPPGQLLSTLPPALADEMHTALRTGHLLNVAGRVHSTVAISMQPTSANDARTDARKLAYEQFLKDVCFHAIAPKTKSGQETILVVIPRKDFDVYAAVKRCADLRLGVKTVCLTHTNLSDGFDQQKAANLALKYNIKGRGNNHVLQESDLGNLRRKDRDGQISAIVLGADVAHPTNGAVNGCPSIACVVGTTDDDFMQFPGSMRLQAGRQEGIEELADMVFERLVDWGKKHDGKLPNRMLFYRDGVSESQYEIVREKEIPQLQTAYNNAQEYLYKLRLRLATPPSRKNFAFELTFVVVGKRHNTRFYPLSDAGSFQTGRARTTNGNVQPGLVIDQVITHRYAMDFFLQSHNPIKGTGRSAHYYVLKNQIDFSADELQKITHAFCYSYARATRGVSYCAPAYYADRLCDRGRAYLRHWLMSHEDPAWTPTKRADGVSDGDYRKQVRDEIYDSRNYRPYPHLPGAETKYGGTRENPWHPKLDDIMFYL